MSKPTLIAYAVKDRGRNQKAIWTKIGAAWPHQDGNGLNIELEVLPLDGRIVLMEPKPAGTESFEDAAVAGGQ